MKFRLMTAFSLALAASLAAAPGLVAQAGGGGAGGGGAAGGGAGGRGGTPMPGMTLTTTGWEDGGVIPAKFVGQMGVSPALSWTNVPAAAVEFVLVMNDPEPVVAPRNANSDILHWMMVKIPAGTTSLAEGAGAAQSTTLPAGARQVQSYRGPGNPVIPMHHYTLTLYALNAPLQLADNADRAAVMAAMDGKVLARAVYMGRYVR